METEQKKGTPGNTKEEHVNREPDELEKMLERFMEEEETRQKQMNKKNKAQVSIRITVGGKGNRKQDNGQAVKTPKQITHHTDGIKGSGRAKRYNFLKRYGEKKSVLSLRQTELDTRI